MIELSRRRLQGTRCQTQEFTRALQNALRNAIRLGLPLDYYVLDVIVDPAQAANCFFPFEAQVRNTVKCYLNPCDPAQVAKEVADSSKCFWRLPPAQSDSGNQIPVSSTSRFSCRSSQYSSYLFCF